MRQVQLDGSLEPLACSHRARQRRSARLLLRTGQIGDVESCRCGHVRVRVRNLRGELECSDWRAPAAHSELPLELPPLLSPRSKP